MLRIPKLQAPCPRKSKLPGTWRWRRFPDTLYLVTLELSHINKFVEGSRILSLLDQRKCGRLRAGTRLWISYMYFMYFNDSHLASDPRWWSMVRLRLVFPQWQLANLRRCSCRRAAGPSPLHCASPSPYSPLCYRGGTPMPGRQRLD